MGIEGLPVSGKAQERKSFDELVQDLHSPRSGTRFWAIKHLGEHGDAAVEPLIQFLQGPPDSEWYTAAEVLGELADPRATRVLTELYLRDPSTVLGAHHYAARDALKRLGTADLSLLLEALRDENSSVRQEYVRQEAASLIGALRLADAADDLVAIAPTTVTAVEALGQIRAATAVPMLLRMLMESDEPYMRAAAATSPGADKR